MDARWPAIPSRSKKTQKILPTHKEEVFAVVHCLETWEHYLGLHKTNVYMDNVFLKYFGIQTQMNVIPLRWHDTLARMHVDKIHKLGRENVILNMLNTQEVFQTWQFG